MNTRENGKYYHPIDDELVSSELKQEYEREIEHFTSKVKTAHAKYSPEKMKEMEKDFFGREITKPSIKHELKQTGTNAPKQHKDIIERAKNKTLDARNNEVGRTELDRDSVQYEYDVRAYAELRDNGKLQDHHQNPQENFTPEQLDKMYATLKSLEAEREEFHRDPNNWEQDKDNDRER